MTLDDGHGFAGHVQTQVAQVVAIKQDGSRGWLTQAHDQFQQGSAARSAGSHQSHAMPTIQPQVGFNDAGGRGVLTGIVIAQLPDTQRGRAAGWRAGFAPVRFHRQVQQVPQFVHAGHQFVVAHERLAQAAEPGQHGADNQFRGDELSQGQLTLYHHPTAETQQGRIRQGVQNQDTDLLPHHDREMTASGVQIIAGQSVGGGFHETLAIGPFDQGGVAGQVLQPGGHGILAA